MIGAVWIPVFESIGACGDSLEFDISRVIALVVGTCKVRSHQNVRSGNFGADGVNPLSRVDNLRLKFNRDPVCACPECRGSTDSNSTSGEKVP